MRLTVLQVRSTRSAAALLAYSADASAGLEDASPATLLALLDELAPMHVPSTHERPSSQSLMRRQAPSFSEQAE